MNTNRVLNNANIKNIKDSIQNISLYDVKAYVRKAQNVMMNFTVMEAKVREATNNEPWGASGSLMQEIADGTFNYANFNEIMPMIYKRFTEKSAHEWRQIYKALQLLEFLIKHGSERVVDDARAHIATISMLRAFHYTDPNGKDQGINVRNRSKELVALLGDDEKIREERKKARAAKDKFVGVSSDGGFGGSGKKYGGFGSDALEYGGYSGGVFGDGGGFGGSSSASNDYSENAYSRHDTGRGSFEEYDAGPSTTTTSFANEVSSSVKKAPEPAQQKAPEVDLFSFDDSVEAAAEPAPETLNTASAPSAAADLDDDFTDFQSAAPATTTKPFAGGLTDLYNSVQPQSSFAQPSFAQPSFAQPSYVQPSFTQPSFTQPSFTQPPLSQPAFSQPAYGVQSPPVTTPTLVSQPSFGAATFQQPATPSFSTVPTGAFRSSYSSGMTTPVGPSLASVTPSPASQSTKKKDDAFASLLGATTLGLSKKPSNSSGNATMGQLAQQTAQAGIWEQASAGSTPKPSSSNNNFDDLLM